WPESIRAMQRNWIGRSHGAQVTFPVAGFAGRAEASFDVFTTRADTLFGATFCVLSPEHALLSDPTALPEAWPEGTEDAWTGAVGGEPDGRPRAARVHRGLRADRLRHRRDHGRARRGRARLRVRRPLRPARDPHRATPGRLRGRRLDRRGREDQLRERGAGPE